LNSNVEVKVIIFLSLLPPNDEVCDDCHVRLQSALNCFANHNLIKIRINTAGRHSQHCFVISSFFFLLFYAVNYRGVERVTCLSVALMMLTALMSKIFPG
jgi:hypothetical protein